MRVSAALTIMISAATSAAAATPTTGPALEAGLTTIAAVKASVETGAERCTAIIASHLARIRREDERLRSIVAINPHAMDEARRIDRQPVGVRRLLPLLCAPLLVKDNIDVVGLATTGGSYALRNNIATRDAAVVAAARKAGAIVIAKTNMSEFALNFRGKSAIRGQTKSSLGVDESAGGSSSGNAAALAAGIGIIALGTDTSGSIRVPAALTGTIGLRPTFGRVSLLGVMPLSPSQDTVGPMCRHADDCSRLLEVIAPRRQGDRDFSTQRSLKGLRIGVLRGLLPSGSPGSRLTAVIDRALAQLTAAGAVLTDVTLADEFVLTGAKPPPGETALFMSRSAFDFPDVMDAYLPARQGAPHDFADLATRLDALVLGGREEEAVVAEVKKLGLNRDLKSVDPRARVNGPFRDAFVAPRIRAAFEGVAGAPAIDVLLYPSAQDVSFPAASGPDTKGTHRLAAYSGYPAVAFPIGVTDDTIDPRPGGIELLARPGEERMLLAIASAWERLQGPAPPQPAIEKPRHGHHRQGAPDVNSPI